MEVTDADDHYPFGLAIQPNSYRAESAINQNYKYNGKELQSEITTYDFEWRMYDPILGRTFQHDPLADNFYEWSPYHRVGNNPILNIDPDGQDWFSYTNEDDVETVIWVEGDTETVEIDGITYNNIGTSYSQTLEDGTVIHYEQNEIINIFDAEATAEETLTSEQDILEFFGEDFDVEVVPERTNEQINKEIVNFFWSWFGQGDEEEGTTAPPLLDRDPLRKTKSTSPGFKEHRKNKRKSNKPTHEKGEKRRKQKYNDKKRQKDNWKQSPNKKKKS